MIRARSSLACVLLILTVGAAIFAGLAGAWTVAGGLVEAADPWLRPFVPVLDTVAAALTGQGCAAASVGLEVAAAQPQLAC